MDLKVSIVLSCPDYYAYASVYCLLEVEYYNVQSCWPSSPYSLEGRASGFSTIVKLLFSDIDPSFIMSDCLGLTVLDSSTKNSVSSGMLMIDCLAAL